MKKTPLQLCVYCATLLTAYNKVGDAAECRRCKSIKRDIYKVAYMKGYNKAKKNGGYDE